MIPKIIVHHKNIKSNPDCRKKNDLLNGFFMVLKEYGYSSTLRINVFHIEHWHKIKCK